MSKSEKPKQPDFYSITGSAQLAAGIIRGKEILENRCSSFLMTLESSRNPDGTLAIISVDISHHAIGVFGEDFFREEDLIVHCTIKWANNTDSGQQFTSLYAELSAKGCKNIKPNSDTGCTFDIPITQLDEHVFAESVDKTDIPHPSKEFVSLEETFRNRVASALGAPEIADRNI